MEVEEIDVNEDIGEVGRILREEEKKRGILIHTLQEIQEKHRYLPEEELQNLSRKFNLSLAEIYSVASFYKMFYFTPRGEKIVKVCLGTACYVRGSKKVLTALEEKFGIKDGETTSDLSLTLETVGCLGCCGLAPVSTINEEIIGEVGEKKIEKFIKSIEEG